MNVFLRGDDNTSLSETTNNYNHARPTAIFFIQCFILVVLFIAIYIASDFDFMVTLAFILAVVIYLLSLSVIYGLSQKAIKSHNKE